MAGQRRHGNGDGTLTTMATEGFGFLTLALLGLRQGNVDDDGNGSRLDKDLGFRRSPCSAHTRVGPLTRWRALRNGATHDDNDGGVMGKDGTMGNEGATGDGATTVTWQWGQNIDGPKSVIK